MGSFPLPRVSRPHVHGAPSRGICRTLYSDGHRLPDGSTHGGPQSGRRFPSTYSMVSSSLTALSKLVLQFLNLGFDGLAEVPFMAEVARVDFEKRRVML